jgi:hypothetical protein
MPSPWRCHHTLLRADDTARLLRVGRFDAFDLDGQPQPPEGELGLVKLGVGASNGLRVLALQDEARGNYRICGAGVRVLSFDAPRWTPPHSLPAQIL